MSRAPRMIESNAEFIDAEADDVTQQVNDDQSEEDDLASEFGNADGDTRLFFKVHRIVAGSKDPEYCMEGTAADLPITPKLQEQWGAGKYRIQLFKNGKYHRRWIVAVAPPPRFARDAQQINGGVNAVNDPRLIGLLERVVAQTQIVAPPAPTMMEIAALITAAIPAVAALKELFKPEHNTLQLFKDAMEMATQFQGDGGREPSIVEVIGNVLTKTDLLNQLGSIVPNAAQANPRATPQIAAPPKTPLEQQQQATANQLKAQLQYLIGRAQKGSDPALYAEVVLDTFDPALVRQFILPGAIDFILTMHPPCALFRPWFEALLTALAEQAQDADGAQSDEPAGVPQEIPRDTFIFDPIGGVGHARDPSIDGEAGAGGQNEN